MIINHQGLSKGHQFHSFSIIYLYGVVYFVLCGGLLHILGGDPRVVVSTAAFHARVRGSVPGLGGLKETKLFLPHPRVKVSIVGSLRDREVACSASDRQGSNFESCVWRTVSSQSPHHPQEVLLAQLSLYVHKSGLKPDSFHYIYYNQGIWPILQLVWGYKFLLHKKLIYVVYNTPCNTYLSKQCCRNSSNTGRMSVFSSDS